MMLDRQPPAKRFYSPRNCVNPRLYLWVKKWNRRLRASRLLRDPREWDHRSWCSHRPKLELSELLALSLPHRSHGSMVYKYLEPVLKLETMFEWWKWMCIGSSRWPSGGCMLVSRTGHLDEQTCGQYMQNCISRSGGYLTNSDASSSYGFCSTRTTDGFLSDNFNAFYSNHWRNVGLMAAFIIFNNSYPKRNVIRINIMPELSAEKSSEIIPDQAQCDINGLGLRLECDLDLNSIVMMVTTRAHKRPYLTGHSTDPGQAPFNESFVHQKFSSGR
ncbi:hypothetical protein ARMSODRAFT_1003017 [Armillaria solidipes]|uniref:Uncharacterized protein n=1 Tax=Armillaria solidipes TaxID=1076256 RepID=A0A2H3BQF8_9AGAR|nr:hypothetical protein ARMSODRAFT_1003017 [Armillaria solidipes]